MGRDNARAGSKETMRKLHVVSNRLPITVKQGSSGFTFQPSVGGLATGLKSFHEQGNCLWTGWPGLPEDELSLEDKAELKCRLEERKFKPVHLSREEIGQFYEGFCNKTIWPHFHYFSHLTEYSRSLWDAYVAANQKFCDVLAEVVGEQDDVWIHDYQLLLLPRMLKEIRPEATIGFFLHIPFPSFELFRLLPWRVEILEGMMGADLIGFHTYEYIRHFLSSVRRVLACEHTLSSVNYGNRLVHVDIYPMGIDFQRYAQGAASDEVRQQVAHFREKVGGKKVILSVDRLDYTKGLPQRLASFDRFLAKYPQYHEKIVMVMVEVPSRTGVDSYADLKSVVDEQVGSINGRYSTMGWAPVHYMAASQPFETLCALYRLADVALLTPVRDGMNLIAKEYVAANSDGTGVLVLSETAGAAQELPEAIIVNPNNYEEVATAIHTALDMPEPRQRHAIESMTRRLSRYSVQVWAGDFLRRLAAMREEQSRMKQRMLSHDAREALLNDYRGASRRLLLVDVDYSFVPGVDKSGEEPASNPALESLAQLAQQEGNQVLVLSGQSRERLDWCFHGVPVKLVAEHGTWMKCPGRDWQRSESVSADWKEEILPIMQLYADRTPGSRLEEKEFALVWHYRNVNTELATLRRSELREDIINLAANLDLAVMEGDKVIEIRNATVTKGNVVWKQVESQPWDFILGMGAETADEEIFHLLPETAYSIKVGFGGSYARFNVRNVEAARHLLADLAQS